MLHTLLDMEEGIRGEETDVQNNKQVNSDICSHVVVSEALFDAAFVHIFRSLSLLSLVSLFLFFACKERRTVPVFLYLLIISTCFVLIQEHSA